MKRITITLITVLMAGLLGTSPATAAPPFEGVVVEGTSVTKAHLGMLLSEITRAWGPPANCNLQGTVCYWTRGNPHRVTAWLQSSRALAFEHTGFPAWVTTRGITTRIASEDPRAVLAAYPEAQVFLDVDLEAMETTPQPVNGVVLDAELGIAFWFSADPVTGEQLVRMTIMEPKNEPAPIKRVVVREGTLRLARAGTALAAITLADEAGDPVPEATVYGSWTLPGGEVTTVSSVSDPDGVARFVISAAATGDHCFTIDQVTADERFYDRRAPIPTLRVHVEQR